MRFRAQLQEIAEEIERGEQDSRFRRLARATFKKALAGEEWAAKELFARLCGKHPAFDDEPPPTPPASCSGEVTINTQVNNHHYAVLPPKQAERLEKLIGIGLDALERDNMLEQE